jgi:hypothetical protein
MKKKKVHKMKKDATKYESGVRIAGSFIMSKEKNSFS